MHNLIIDGSNLLSANIAKNTEDYTGNGYYIGGVIGTLRAIAKCIRDLECNDRVFVTFDLFKSAYRLAMHDGYKDGRGEFSDADLEFRFSHRESHSRILSRILPSLNVHVLIMEDMEADDVIANYVNQTKHHTTIISTDNDFIQLVNDKVSVYRPVTKEFISIDNVNDYLGYPLAYFKTVKILSGDKSDNICGIRGVADKTAVKIIEEAKGTGKHEIMNWTISKLTGKKPLKYIENLKLFLDQGLYEYNEALMDLHNGPKFDIMDIIYETEFDEQKVLDIFQELGYNKYIDQWVFDNFKRIKE